MIDVGSPYSMRPTPADLRRPTPANTLPPTSSRFLSRVTSYMECDIRSSTVASVLRKKKK